LLKVLQGISNHRQTASATYEVINQLKKQPIDIILFFCSDNYDFKEASFLFYQNFPNTRCVGSVVAGGISKAGFTDQSIVAIGLSSPGLQIEVTVIEEIETIPMIYRERVASSFQKLKVNLEENNTFGILFVDGLRNAEEKVLSVIQSIFPTQEFPLIGGSAGDNGKFVETLSYNGSVYSNAAILTTIKTNHPFFLYRENIFIPKSEPLIVTKADIRDRKIYEINHVPAAKYYAKEIGVTVEQLSNYFMSHPFGRLYKNEYWIASPFQINPDLSITTYAQIIPNSEIYIMKPLDPVEVAKKTASIIANEVNKPKAILAFSCVLRNIQFKKEKNGQAVYKALSKSCDLFGATTYGEQIGRFHLNHTLTLLAIGE